ncbi:cobalamin biosynthesis protein [Palleronia caenipelagi]|uniref:Cobalamin biosynthesis protein n=1 Tax=Palleronia caenipelagi TaxID=2489174 RepID=A0A547Q937_9RHOB|nr:cobalamin biosynthesis protein [Palleronia caenipelagi]TRD22892.1 cobalamin biosynthesis protein [Palleronia caenipelagi]
MIVAGFGFRSGATVQSLASALAATGITPDALASIADKCASPAFVTLAGRLNLPIIPVPPEDLPRSTPTRSTASLAARETGSVAEASALAAAGPGAHLLIARQIAPDRQSTCAIAEGATP